MKKAKISALKCPQDYYDVYSISFPFKALGSIKRNKYICSELEKLHPCFSDDCCFDSKIRFSKTGLKADIIVMQKFRLAEYKNQNNQKPVYVAEFKKLPFFKDLRSKQKIYTFFFASILFLLLLFVFGRVKNKGIKEQIPAAKNQEEVSLVVSEENPFAKLQEVLELVSLHDGRILHFSWDLNGFSQNFSLTVKNIYPETVCKIAPEVKILSITYENNIPLMTIQLNLKVNSSSVLNVMKNQEGNSAAELRDFLLQNNFIIIEESVNPYGIKVQLPVKEFQKISVNQKFNSFFEFMLDKKLSVSSLSIKPAGDYLFFSILFSDVFLSNQNELYKSIIDNSKIFLENYENQNEINLGGSPSSRENSTKQFEKIKGKDIGKIIRTDGTTVEFYKDEKGRIKQK